MGRYYTCMHLTTDSQKTDDDSLRDANGAQKERKKSSHGRARARAREDTHNIYNNMRQRVARHFTYIPASLGINKRARVMMSRRSANLVPGVSRE